MGQSSVYEKEKCVITGCQQRAFFLYCTICDSSHLAVYVVVVVHV